MTKRERERAAAKWRRIARAFERNGHGERPSVGISSAGLCHAADLATTREPVRVWLAFAEPIELFDQVNGLVFYWTRDRKGDDCRVIAAGLLAAMCDAGDL
jgi:hypothetical protein